MKNDEKTFHIATHDYHLFIQFWVDIFDNMLGHGYLLNVPLLMIDNMITLFPKFIQQDLIRILTH